MPELVLVRPGFNRRAEAHWANTVSLGLGYIAGSARRNGIDVAVVDAKLRRHIDVRDTFGAICSLKPKVVGISAMTVEYEPARRIAKLLKDSSIDPITILGGIHANALPVDSISESPEFDFVVSGESDYLFTKDRFREMTDRSPAFSFPGLYQRCGDEIICVRQPEIVNNLDELPFPAWDLFPRVDEYPLLTERGCPYKCVFCCHNSSRRLRRRSLDNVMNEIEWLYESFRPRRINIEDETFGISRQRTLELLDRISAFRKGRDIRFKAQTRADVANVEMMRAMKSAGFDYVELGAESGDNAVLDNSGKNITREQIIRAVRITREAGIKVWLNFIIGLPGETLDTIKHTRDLAAALNPDRLSVAVIVAYPGSQIYDWARHGDNGYRLLSEKFSDFDKYIGNSVELENLSISAMRKQQIKIYLTTYIKNRRLMGLFKLAWKNRILIPSIMSAAFRRFGRNPLI